MNEALVLLAHGSREPGWAKPLEQLVETLAARRSVRLAYLELMQPALAEAVGALVAAGARRIAVVPLFLGAGGHVRRDLPALCEAARAAHPEIEIRLLPPIGEQPEVLRAIAGAVETLLG